MPRMTRWPMRIECWKTKAVGTHSEFVILIAFLLQLWLYERATNVTLYVHCFFVCVCVCVYVCVCVCVCVWWSCMPNRIDPRAMQALFLEKWHHIILAREYLVFAESRQTPHYPYMLNNFRVEICRWTAVPLHYDCEWTTHDTFYLALWNFQCWFQFAGSFSMSKHMLHTVT